MRHRDGQCCYFIAGEGSRTIENHFKGDTCDHSGGGFYPWRVSCVPELRLVDSRAKSLPSIRNLKRALRTSVRHDATLLVWWAGYGSRTGAELARHKNHTIPLYLLNRNDGIMFYSLFPPYLLLGVSMEAFSSAMGSPRLVIIFLLLYYSRGVRSFLLCRRSKASSFRRILCCSSSVLP